MLAVHGNSRPKRYEHYRHIIAPSPGHIFHYRHGWITKHTATTTTTTPFSRPHIWEFKKRRNGNRGSVFMSTLWELCESWAVWGGGPAFVSEPGSLVRSFSSPSDFLLSAFFLYTLASRVTANIVFLVYSYTISYFISARGVVRWNTYRKLTETNRKSCLSGEKTSPLLPAVVV